MTKKKFVKSLMSHGVQRNMANNLAKLLITSDSCNYENTMNELTNGNFHLRAKFNAQNTQLLKDAGIIFDNKTMRITLSDELKNVYNK